MDSGDVFCTFDTFATNLHCILLKERRGGVLSSHSLFSVYFHCVLQYFDQSRQYTKYCKNGSQIVPKAASDFLFLLICCHWSIFSSVQCTGTCHSRLSENFSELQASFGTTFRVTGGYLKAGTSFLNMVAGRIFRISKRCKNF